MLNQEEFDNRMREISKAKNKKNIIIVLAALGFVVFMHIIINTNKEKQVKSHNGVEISRTSSSSSYSKQWFKGGNLHKATVAQWKGATHQNKLATAADWLAGTIWEGYLTSPDDFNKLKVKAQMLVNAVDGVVTVKKTDYLKVTELATAIIIMSNDLGP